jgi:hypothetical protein
MAVRPEACFVLRNESRRAAANSQLSDIPQESLAIAEKIGSTHGIGFLQTYFLTTSRV